MGHNSFHGSVARGGGAAAALVALGEEWHASRSLTVHFQLLPIQRVECQSASVMGVGRNTQ